MAILAYEDEIRVRGTAQEATMGSPLALKIGKVNHGLNIFELWNDGSFLLLGRKYCCISCNKQKKWKEREIFLLFNMKQEKEYWDLSNVHVYHFQMTITLQNNILCAKQNGEITYVEYVYH